VKPLKGVEEEIKGELKLELVVATVPDYGAVVVCSRRGKPYVQS